MASKHRYQPLEDVEVADVRHRTYSSTWMVATLSLLLNAVLAAILGFQKQQNLDRICSTYTQEYASPILRDINIKYESKTFFPGFQTLNAFQANGSREVDAEWASLGINFPPFVVTEEEGLRAGLTGRARYKSGGYVAAVEGLHHLHCLNLVRKALYYNFDYYYTLGEMEFSMSAENLHHHTTHCLDIVRQQLMCTPDTSLFGWVAVKDHEPTPDFRTKHKCKNFEAIGDWTRERSSRSNVTFGLLEDGDILVPEVP